MRLTRLACALLALALAAACTPSARDGRDDTDTDPPVTPAPDAGGGTTTHPDGGGTTTPPDGGGTSVPNQAPAVSLVTPASASGDVAISIVVFDAERDPVSLVAEWSDDGSSWHQLTARTSLTSLPSSPDGVEQSLVWRSTADVPGRTAQVRVRLVPRDLQHTGVPAQTGFFLLDNRQVQPPQDHAPGASWTSVPSPVKGNATLSFLAVDAESDPVNTTIEWRLANGPWQPASIVSSPAAFGTSPGGVTNSVVWASAADVPGAQQNVQLRVQLDDGQLQSVWAESFPFAVDNGTTVTPPSASTVRFSEINGGEQEDWFELTNLGTQTASVAGFQIKWEAAGNSGTFAFPTASQVGTSLLTIAPGGRLLVSDQTRPSTGAEPGVLYLGQNIRWGSAVEGSAELLDAAGASVDFVRWEGSTQQPAQGTFSDPTPLYLPSDDTSLVRIGATDTNSAADFCVAQSSRNAPNNSCAPKAPTGARIRISELSSGADATGSGQPWIEIVNAGQITVPLAGWIIASEGTTASTQTHLQQQSLVPGARLVVRDGTGTVTSGVQYTGGSLLSWGSWGEVSLRDPAGVPQDFVRFGGNDLPAPPPLTFASSPPVPGPNASSTISRLSGTIDQSPSNWCLTQPTAGLPNAACKPPPQSGGVRLTEIADGSITNFLSPVLGAIEIANLGSTTVDLTDYRIRWGAGGLATTDGFGIGAVVLRPGDYVQFVECQVIPILPDDPNCVGVMPWGAGSGTGSNDNGYVELLDYTGLSVDFVRWGSSTQLPAAPGTWTNDVALRLPDNDSLARRANSSDTNRASDWCHQARTLGAPNTACQP